MPSRADAILHPVRVRIVQALASQELTPLELAVVLADVPQASLYRHLNRLHADGIIAVVGERRVRATTEHRYALATPEAARADGGDDGPLAEDQLQAFTTFVATLLGDFSRAIERAGPGAGGAGYRQVELHLDLAELEGLLHAIGAAVVKVLGNQPQPGRTKWLLSTIVTPGFEDGAARQ